MEMQILSAISQLSTHNMLRFKYGFIVILLWNLYPKIGHMNVARYDVENMTNNVLLLSITSRIFESRRPTLPWVNCGFGEDLSPFSGFKFLQFPYLVALQKRLKMWEDSLLGKAGNQPLWTLLFSWSAGCMRSCVNPLTPDHCSTLWWR